MTCKYYDCGWCYAPKDVEHNSKNGSCIDPLSCPYNKKNKTPKTLRLMMHPGDLKVIKYSDKEQQLINALHFGDLLSQEPAVTYRTLYPGDLKVIKYSDKEQQLINALHLGDLLSQEPAITYRTLALYCFSKGLQGSLADSVRRCYNAMVNSYPYRLTKDFDDLIEFTNFRRIDL